MGADNKRNLMELELSDLKDKALEFSKLLADEQEKTIKLQREIIDKQQEYIRALEGRLRGL